MRKEVICRILIRQDVIHIKKKSKNVRRRANRVKSHPIIFITFSSSSLRAATHPPYSRRGLYVIRFL